MKKDNSKNDLLPLIDEMINSDDPIQYHYQIKSPQFVNPELLDDLIESIREKNENLVIAPEQIKEYTGRNNRITQLRKIVQQITAIKRKIHREAAASYQSSDEFLDEKINTLTELIDNLALQVNTIQEKERQKKIKEINHKYNDLLDEFKGSINYENSEFVNDNLFSFEAWFDNKKLRLSQTKLLEDISTYLSNQFDEYKKYYLLSQNDDVLLKLFKDKYVGDASEAYFEAQQMKQEIDKYAKIKEEQTQQEQIQQEQTQDESPKTNNEKIEDNTINCVSDADRVLYLFGFNDALTAKKVKAFCDENDLNYSFKRHILD